MPSLVQWPLHPHASPPTTQCSKTIYCDKDTDITTFGKRLWFWKATSFFTHKMRKSWKYSLLLHEFHTKCVRLGSPGPVLGSLSMNLLGNIGPVNVSMNLLGNSGRVLEYVHESTWEPWTSNCQSMNLVENPGPVLESVYESTGEPWTSTRICPWIYLGTLDPY